MIIFDDARGEFGPLTDLRASFELRTGALTTAERIAAVTRTAPECYWVPQNLAELVAERCGAPVNRVPAGDAVLCLNGRWAAPYADVHLESGEALVEGRSGDVVAALLPPRDAKRLLERGDLPDGARRRTLEGDVLYRRPWEILRWMGETIPRDILLLRGRTKATAPRGATVVGEHTVDVHEKARLYPGVVLDAERGPIRIEQGAIARPGAVLCGPCFVGRDSVVADRALIKPNTVFGPVCKVGGEVGGTIFQGFSNKVHDGHLGDSWVGEWVNVGAGTDNSNLLNTYGEVAMRLEADGMLERSGLQYVGAFIGDHAKLAIQSRVPTGAVIGTGAMVATTETLPQVVRRFAWLTDRGVQAFRFEKFLQTARAMMARRGVEPTETYVAALRALHGKR